jgi:MYXO-CTERM domain-containing protein
MKLSYVAAVGIFAMGSSAFANGVVDQMNDVQGYGQGWAYLNSSFEGAQPFVPTANQICGASVFIGSYWGTAGEVTLGIYTTNPYTDGGANPVPGAAGTVYNIAAGSWADVSWSPVGITPGNTYWLAPRGNGSGVYNYTSNPYPSGGIHWYGTDYGPSGYYMVFKTWAPIPAPGAAALLGLGGLAAARRRR